MYVQNFIQLCLNFDKAMPRLVRLSSEFLYFTRKNCDITKFGTMMQNASVKCVAVGVLTSKIPRRSTASILKIEKS